MVGENPIGKWTYDDENRKKYPKNKLPPQIIYPKENSNYSSEAYSYVNTHFKNNYGHLNTDTNYPSDFVSAKNWLNNFLKERFTEFGDYEDAIVKGEAILNHSLISPLIK